MTPTRHRDGARTETCVACGDAELEPFIDLGHVPVATTSLYRTREEAVTAPLGRMVLHVCPGCGLVRNVAFSATAVAYDTEYENSQHFSPIFQRYAEQLADRLTETYGLKGATVADIGCGKGEFLALLCERAHAHGIGFDPTYDGQIDGSRQQIEIRPEFYPGSSGDLNVQLVACRHVLEHLESPDELLTTLRGSLTAPVPVYFEVPNAQHVFTRSGMWDIIFQHVSYFDAHSLRAIFEHCGFEVTRLTEPFQGQFLSLDAVPARGRSRTATSPNLAGLYGFELTFEEARRSWERFASDNADRRAVLWGAGAKGVSFLNLTAVGHVVQAVVDVNPRKQGAWVPGTAQPIISPADLADVSPDIVIVANQIYRTEIQAELDRLGLQAELVCL